MPTSKSDLYIFEDSDYSHVEMPDKLPEHSANPEIIFNMVRRGALLGDDSLLDLSHFKTTYFDRYSALLMQQSMGEVDPYDQNNNEIVSKCSMIVSALWNLPYQGSVGALSSKYEVIANVFSLYGLDSACEGKVILITSGCDQLWSRLAEKKGLKYKLVDNLNEECFEKNTRLVVCTVGSELTGGSGDIVSIGKFLNERPTKIPLHVDAEGSGFLLPFTDPKKLWDFRVDAVSSISAAAEKSGLTYPNLQWLGVRNPNERGVYSALPLPQIVVQYYRMISLGRDGLSDAHRRCLKIADYMIRQINEIEGLKIINNDPDIPVVIFSAREPESSALVVSIEKGLAKFGWRLATYELSQTDMPCVVLRVAIRYGMSMEIADIFLADLSTVVDELL